LLLKLYNQKAKLGYTSGFQQVAAK
jgi:hypothetical protein